MINYRRKYFAYINQPESNLQSNRHFDQDTALERATNTFKVLDVNGDGELNEDEFVEGCMQVNLVKLRVNYWKTPG